MKGFTTLATLTVLLTTRADRMTAMTWSTVAVLRL